VPAGLQWMPSWIVIKFCMVQQLPCGRMVYNVSTHRGRPYDSVRDDAETAERKRRGVVLH
jgi:hypothetical protein